jgi:predicted DNA-binding protein (MmcQ/YjbR family)
VPSCSPPEHRLDIDDRRPVHGFEIPNPNSPAVDRSDLHLVQPDRVRAIGGAGVEHSLQGIGDVVARMDAQDIATSAIQPREEDDLIPRSDALQAFEHGRVEHQPRVGRPLVALLGRRGGVGQGRLDLPDRPHFEAGFVHLIALQVKTPARDSLLRLKADPVEREALLAQGEPFYLPPYVGAKGWVGVRLDAPGIDWEEVAELIATGYCLIAPKRLAAQVTAPPSLES